MYNVSQIYKNLIGENDRLFSIAITVEHEQGTIDVTDKDLAQGSFSYEASSQPGEDFTIGGVVAASIQFTLMGEYEGIDFLGAIVTPVVFLEDEDNPNWKEGVPLGRFYVDTQTREMGNVELKALDGMIFLDKPYSESELSYPATLLQIYTSICDDFNIVIGTPSFLNSTYSVPERPTGETLTYRDVLSAVAALSGSFAHCDRLGRMVLKWYEGTEREVGPVHRFSFKPSENRIQITGVSYKECENTYLAGEDGYVIDLTDNILFLTYSSGVLTAIYNRIGLTDFYPYTADWQGDPALEVGDRVKHTSVEGLVYSSIVTHTSFKYRGQSVISAKSKTPEARKFKGSTSKQLNEVIRSIRESHRDYNEHLTAIEEAKIQAMRLLTGALGGYYIEEESAIYIANAPTLQDATEYWVWNINGFGHFVDGILDTAITSDSSIVASMIHAGLITADMIRLSSDTDSTLDEVLDSIDESIDVVSDTLGRIDTEQRITALDRLALKAEYDRIRVENNHLALILADVDDSMFGDYEGSISEYDTAATAVLGWLAYATDAPNFSDVDTSEWGDLQTDYLLSLDRVNQLVQAVETQHRAYLTSQMLEFEQVQGQFQERLKIDAQGMTINVDDENALTIRNDGMRIYVEGVERAEFTSSGFRADQGRVDVLQVGAHIVSRDGDFTVWRPI